MAAGRQDGSRKRLHGPAPQSAGAERVATIGQTGASAVVVGLALDAESDDRIAEGIVDRTLGGARAGNRANSENRAAAFADVEAVAVGDALHAAVAGDLTDAPIHAGTIPVGQAFDAVPRWRIAVRERACAAILVAPAPEASTGGGVAHRPLGRAFVVPRTDGPNLGGAANEIATDVAAAGEPEHRDEHDRPTPAFRRRPVHSTRSYHRPCSAPTRPVKGLLIVLCRCQDSASHARRPCEGAPSFRQAR
jgi:hypothetical protein